MEQPRSADSFSRREVLKLGGVGLGGERPPAIRGRIARVPRARHIVAPYDVVGDRREGVHARFLFSDACCSGNSSVKLAKLYAIQRTRSS